MKNFSDIKDWDGNLEKQQNNDNQTPNQASNPHLILNLLPLSPPNPCIDRYGNPISESSASEEGQKEETSEDLLDNIV